jgi:hypothetical protein
MLTLNATHAGRRSAGEQSGRRRSVQVGWGRQSGKRCDSHCPTNGQVADRRQSGRSRSLGERRRSPRGRVQADASEHGSVDRGPARGSLSPVSGPDNRNEGLPEEVIQPNAVVSPSQRPPRPGQGKPRPGSRSSCPPSGRRGLAKGSLGPDPGRLVLPAAAEAWPREARPGERDSPMPPSRASADPPRTPARQRRPPERRRVRASTSRR